MGRVKTISRHTAVIGLVLFVAPPVHAQPNPTIGLSSEKLEFALLEKSAVFELASISGALKETRQYGQQLIWRVKERPSAEAFRMANLSVGLLRSDTGSQVIATFSGDISSLGYTTSEEVKLHIIFRTKGGVALHTSVVGIRIKCDDKDQSMHPPTDVIPRNIANHVFANVTSVEIAAHTEPHLSVVKILRCN
jgi:hypothetical protein